MTTVLCRRCRRPMTEVPSSWICEPCGGRVCEPERLDEFETAAWRDSRRERNRRWKAALRKIETADWDAIQKSLGVKMPPLRSPGA